MMSGCIAVAFCRQPRIAHCSANINHFVFPTKALCLKSSKTFYIILYHSITFYIILYHSISFYIILYHSISFYIILYLSSAGVKLRQKCANLKYFVAIFAKYFIRSCLILLTIFNTYSMKTDVLLQFEHKNDVTIIVKLLYRATSTSRSEV